MADTDQLLQRNKDLEATCAHEEARIGSFTLPAEVMAGNEARPRRPARRAQRSWRLA